MPEREKHSLPSFSAYLNKGFALRQHASNMRDARQDPEISPSSVFLSLFHSFVFRLPSFQSLERDLKDSYLVDWIKAERAFTDDTLATACADSTPSRWKRCWWTSTSV